MIVIINAENLRKYKSRFSLIVGQVIEVDRYLILAFASSLNMVREVKNLSPTIEQIERRYFSLSYNLGRIIRSVLSLNSKV